MDDEFTARRGTLRVGTDDVFIARLGTSRVGRGDVFYVIGRYVYDSR